MLRTWIRGDGTRYVPSEVPALWRRWADRKTWDEADTVFGPLGSGGPREWQPMHGLLAAVSDLWQPSAANKAIYELANLRARRSDEAGRLRRNIERAIEDGALTIKVELGHVGPTMQAATLGTFLLADCASALDQGARYRRCGHCTEWFTPTRTDAVFCSNACKQAAHAGRQVRRGA